MAGRTRALPLRAEVRADGAAARAPGFRLGEALRARPRLVGALVVLLAALGAVLVQRFFPPLIAAGTLADDRLLASLTPARPQHPRIAIVALTDRTFAELRCRSPVDRLFLAGLVGQLAGKGVAAIGIDLLFDQPTLDEADAKLRDALRTSPVPVVAITAHAATDLNGDQRGWLATFLDGVRTGHANLPKDRIDGVVRRHDPLGSDGQPSFPAALARAVGVEVPAERFEIAWLQPSEAGGTAFPVYPAEAVGLLPAAWLQGRIVLIGVTVGDVDRHRTPVAPAGRTVPGVEIQAHTLAQLLDGRAHPRVGDGAEIAVAVALAGVGALIATLGLGLVGQIAVGLAAVAAFWVAVAALLGHGGPYVPPVAPSLAMVTAFGVTGGALHLRERADRRVLMRLFASHLSAPIAARIWEQRDAFMAGGRPKPQELTATLLFSDIQDFTPVAERLSPAQVMGWLEGYFERMVHLVAVHEGVVLRFIGDALFAGFGLPIARTRPEEVAVDAVAAVRCALAMAEALEQLNLALVAGGLPPVGIRIGIHTGAFVVGSLGTSEHVEYSIVGDVANTAARLEAYGKTLRAQQVAAGQGARACTIVVGDATWDLLGGRFAGRDVGALELKGKAKRVRAYEIRGESGP